MSQMNYGGGFGDLDPDRSQPRYQPGSVGPEQGRPSSWPSPDSVESDPSTPSYPAPTQGNWGNYRPGNPVNGSGSGGGPRYDYSRYSQPSQPAQPYSQPYNGGYYSDYNDYDNNGYTNPGYGLNQPPYDPQRLAAEQAQAKISFYRHLAIYAVINVFLWAVSIPFIFLSHGHFNPFFITFFWGLGLFFQYQRAFGKARGYRRHMVEREMRHMRRTVRHNMRHRRW